jgi:hypothetical protein
VEVTVTEGLGSFDVAAPGVDFEVAPIVGNVPVAGPPLKTVDGFAEQDRRVL